jgi:hypothetical protein
VAAGTIVARQLGGTPIARDVPGGAEGTHDLDVELPDGRRIALEVTSAGDEGIESLRSAAFKVWKAPSLNSDWWLGLPMEGQFSVKPAMANVVPHLAVLEQHDLREVGGSLRPRDQIPTDAHEDAVRAVRAVFNLGVRRATRLGPPNSSEPAKLLVSLSGSAGSNFDAMNDLVAERARKKVDKLTAAAGHERHLFVWIRSSASDAELAIATLPPPASTPALADGIGVVWVATSGGPDALYARLLRLRPRGRWETISTSRPSA